MRRRCHDVDVCDHVMPPNSRVSSFFLSRSRSNQNKRVVGHRIVDKLGKDSFNFSTSTSTLLILLPHPDKIVFLGSKAFNSQTGHLLLSKRTNPGQRTIRTGITTTYKEPDEDDRRPDLELSLNTILLEPTSTTLKKTRDVARWTDHSTLPHGAWRIIRKERLCTSSSGELRRARILFVSLIPFRVFFSLFSRLGRVGAGWVELMAWLGLWDDRRDLHDHSRLHRKSPVSSSVRPY